MDIGECCDGVEHVDDTAKLTRRSHGCAVVVCMQFQSSVLHVERHYGVDVLSRHCHGVGCGVK